MSEIIKYIFLIECVLFISGQHVERQPDTKLDSDDELAFFDGGYSNKHLPEHYELLNDDLFEPIMVRRNDFFLKAAKSVPRIGRRNDFFYAKAHKTVPRVGRRNDFFLKASKNVPRIGRRDEFTSSSDKEASVAWPWFRDHDFLPRVMKKDKAEEKIGGTALNREIEEPRLQALV